MSLIYDFYNGDYSAIDKIIHTDTKYYEAIKNIMDEHDYLKNLLTPKEQRHLNSLIDSMNTINDINGYDHFKVGFQEGAKLVTEIYGVNGVNTIDEELEVKN